MFAKVAVISGLFVTLVSSRYATKMRLINKVYPLLFLGIVLLTTWSCRREFEGPEVENELLTPILSTELDIGKIVPDSLRSEDSEGLVSLVYRNTLYEASLDAFEPLNTREFDRSAKLQELRLPQREVENAISLGQIAEQDSAYGPLIIALNGNTFQIPEIQGLSFGPTLLDGSEYFDEMTLDSGTMTVTIHNGFPTSISDIDFTISNQVNQDVVVQESFVQIDPGQTESKVTDLAGKSVESYLEAMVANFDIDSSNGPVLIDTSDKITVTVTISKLKVFSAIAIFPAQNIIDQGDINAMENVGSTRIVHAIAKQGFVNVEVQSTVEDTLYFDYFIPEGRLDGQPFEIHEKINPAPPNGSISKVYQYDVSGYEFGMTGFPVKDSFNVFYSELVGRIDSTGKKVNITLEDSIRVFVNLSGFVPEYFEGYGGDTIVSVGPESVPFELFNKIDGGSIDFELVNMAISVSNGNNVPFDVAVNSLKASNSKTGKSVTVNLGSIPNPASVLGAPSLSEAWEMTWAFDEATANLNKVLEILPDRFESSLTIETNPDQNVNDLSQFAVDSNKLRAYADIEIPLSFVAENLTLRDTIAFDPRSLQKPEGIGSGTMYLIANNELPLSADMTMQFLDNTGAVVQSVGFDKRISSGAEGSPVQSVLSWKFEPGDLDKMLTANRVIFSASISTASLNEPVKIHSTQQLGLKLSARFNYLFKP